MDKEIEPPTPVSLRNEWMSTINDLIAELKTQFHSKTRIERKTKLAHSIGYLVQVGNSVLKDAELSEIKTTVQRIENVLNKR